MRLCYALTPALSQWERELQQTKSLSDFTTFDYNLRPCAQTDEISCELPPHLPARQCFRVLLALTLTKSKAFKNVRTRPT